MTPSPSYLQALPKDEAIAFVTSLQKVKDHLRQELAWLNEQVQQKIIQLQRMETLLSEVTDLGLAPLSSAQPLDLTAGAAEPSALIEATIPAINDSDLPFISPSSDPTATVESQRQEPQRDSDSNPPLYSRREKMVAKDKLSLLR